MLPRCRWPVERPFALPPVEARQMPAGNHRPHNAIAIDVQPARREPMNWRVWIVPWQFVDFCKRSRRGIWSGVQSNDCTRESQHRSPDRPVHWTHGDAVESGVDPLVFGGIDGLIGLYILVPLPVAVGVEDERRPSLGFHFIVGLVEHLRVQPSYRSTAATAARPQRVVGGLRKYQVMGTKTGVNERELPRLGIVHGQLPAARFEREQNRRRMARPFFAERWIVTRANPGGDPDSSLFIKHGIVDVGLAVPNGFLSPIRRRRWGLIVAARWRLRVTDWHADAGRCGAHWVEDRQIVNAKSCGAVNCSVGVQCGMPRVGGIF